MDDCVAFLKKALYSLIGSAVQYATVLCLVLSATCAAGPVYVKRFPHSEAIAEESMIVAYRNLETGESFLVGSSEGFRIRLVSGRYLISVLGPNKAVLAQQVEYINQSAEATIEIPTDPMLTLVPHASADANDSFISYEYGKRVPNCAFFVLYEAARTRGIVSDPTAFFHMLGYGSIALHYPACTASINPKEFMSLLPGDYGDQLKVNVKSMQLTPDTVNEAVNKAGVLLVSDSGLLMLVTGVKGEYPFHDSRPVVTGLNVDRYWDRELSHIDHVSPNCCKEAYLLTIEQQSGVISSPAVSADKEPPAPSSQVVRYTTDVDAQRTTKEYTSGLTNISAEFVRTRQHLEIGENRPQASQFFPRSAGRFYKGEDLAKLIESTEANLVGLTHRLALYGLEEFVTENFPRSVPNNTGSLDSKTGGRILDTADGFIKSLLKKAPTTAIDISAYSNPPNATMVLWTKAAYIAEYATNQPRISNFYRGIYGCRVTFPTGESTTWRIDLINRDELRLSCTLRNKQGHSEVSCKQK